MSTKRIAVTMATALVVGLIVPVVAAPSINAAEPEPATNSTPTFASHEDAEPGVAPPGADATAVYLDESGQVIPMTEATDATTGAEVLAGCTPFSGRDNPHWSSGDVSGHGWWKKGTCTGSYAYVYNCLYEYYTDNTFRQKACSSVKKLLPYTGSGQRTNARRDCDTTQVTTWRNHVDVDVIGQNDTAEFPYNQNDVYCRVY